MSEQKSPDQSPRLPRRIISAWFDVRRRRAGSFAFALNRLTGLGLAVYLFLHLGVLSVLLKGESGWDQFIALARSPLFLIFDVVLFFGIIFHGLNGFRVALLGLGVGVRRQRLIFWIVLCLTLILTGTAAFFIFEVSL